MSVESPLWERMGGDVPGVDAMMHIETIATPSLGDRSYVVDDGSQAIVVDPQRDLDRVHAVLDQRGVTPAYVLETHVHNDYVSGGLELARTTGATYALNADDEVFFEFHGLHDGDELVVGGLDVRVLHTPGHTHTHLAYAVRGDGRSAVFTGGSLLYGSVGRTDLVSRREAPVLTRAQYRSARRLADELDDPTLVLPTHGFGSFCSSASSDHTASGPDPALGVETSTIGRQREANLALTISDEDAFVAQLLDGLDTYPRYYVHMAPRNRVGPQGVDLRPPQTADPAELAGRLEAGEWVVDLRSRTAYARDAVPGTVNVGIGSSFTTYLAWILPWGTPVVLVGDHADDLAEAQRQLIRVGIDRPAAGAVGGIDVFGAGLSRTSFRVRDFADLERVVGDGARPHVLDVRRLDERASSSIPGSQHIPLHELDRRIDEVPDDVAVWVHCASGFRAGIAASLLLGRGREPVLVDDDAARIAELDLGRWARAGG